MSKKKRESRLGNAFKCTCKFCQHSCLLTELKFKWNKGKKIYFCPNCNKKVV